MKTVPTSRYIVFSLLAVFGCLADLTTKTWVFAWLGPPQQRNPWWLIKDICGFQTSLNEGALFGMGQGKVWLFASLSVVASVAIVYWLFIVKAARDRSLTVALGLVAGGIFGNLYDRLGLWTMPGQPNQRFHAVRDFILFQYRDWVWPNFNVADSLLVCGAALLVWHAFRAERASSEIGEHPCTTSTSR
ncbi:MAG TPA: signal peptidase II [Pirellulales bacterium]|jgi:signal peptidase II|nr:signal peptidase II [Pirellulales bacterium]